MKDGWGLLLATLKLSTAVILPRQQISGGGDIAIEDLNVAK